MIQFIRFLNIHIYHKTQLAMINVPLKGRHIGIYNKMCSFEHDLTWF
jgi:hypothetical protein